MEQITDKQPMLKPRNTSIAFFLSLLFPGLGQIYNGQPKKGFFFFGLQLLIPFLFGITGWPLFFYGLLLLVVIVLGLRIYIILDSVKHARRQKAYMLKPYNTWYCYLAFIAAASITFHFYDISAVIGIQSFKIPSDPNEPTVRRGDFIVVDANAYKNRPPDYGDIIVFTHADGQKYTYRIVGLPNDKLTLKGNIVTVNGRSGKTAYMKDAWFNGIPVIETEETLPNGHKHQLYLLKEPSDTGMPDIANITVPPDSYYVLGDNRDYAADSRYKGFVKRTSIKGRIIYSYWGKDATRINLDFRKI
ncbi:signal peptidase I [Niabella pedocola]|uniref:Signal peptidase I n=1 Tax=Niabella pedocola TaxID=1752077 RepID=A0ABS8PYF6_9BACT|nr:signal peptidase I [Niabella pedocola]MCD2426102.1 signal peptidase I [Niabella pedocola]